jgi:hypothetical protein
MKGTEYLIGTRPLLGLFCPGTRLCNYSLGHGLSSWRKSLGVDESVLNTRAARDADGA